MRIVTKEELLARATKTVPLESWEEDDPREVRIRKITLGELSAVQAPPIPGSAEWPTEERAARTQAWLDTVPPSERRALQLAWQETDYAILVLACLEPRVTAEEARLFGADAPKLVTDILEFSGLLKPAKESSPDGSAGA